MKDKDVIRLNENEAVLYLSLNWFDLNEDTQNKIIEKASSAMGNENTFEFPNIEIRLLVMNNTKPKNERRTEWAPFC